MLKLVKFLVTALVNDSQAVTIDSTPGEGVEIITVGVADSDMGRVIGRGGKIISAIRELVKVKAIKSGLRVKLVLKDPRQTNPISPSAPSELPPQN